MPTGLPPQNRPTSSTKCRPPPAETVPLRLNAPPPWPLILATRLPSVTRFFTGKSWHPHPPSVPAHSVLCDHKRNRPQRKTHKTRPQKKILRLFGPVAAVVVGGGGGEGGRRVSEWQGEKGKGEAAPR